MIVKLLTEHHLEFLSLKGGCTGSSESTLVKVSNCWKPHAVAHLSITPGLSDHNIKLAKVNAKPEITKQIPRIIPLIKKGD